MYLDWESGGSGLSSVIMFFITFVNLSSVKIINSSVNLLFIRELSVTLQPHYK